jgi:hypothetical protein
LWPNRKLDVRRYSTSNCRLAGYSVETKKKYARLAGVSFSNSRNP